MCLRDLTIFILQNIRPRAMNDSHSSLRWVAESRGVFASFNSTSARFDADQLHAIICDKPAKDSYCI